MSVPGAAISGFSRPSAVGPRLVRGNFIEPHTDRNVPLGTVEVRQYYSASGLCRERLLRLTLARCRRRRVRKTDIPLCCSSRKRGSMRC